MRADTIDMAAYRSRYVALEVAYLGGRYHGLASQVNTEETIEVRPLMGCCYRAAALREGRRLHALTLQ